MIRSSVSLALAAATLASCAGSASAANPLLGRWHLVSWKRNTNPNWLADVCSDKDLVFTPTTVTRYTPQQIGPITVTYNIQPGRVVVSSGNDVFYLLIDAQHIRQDDESKCTYQRVG